MAAEYYLPLYFQAVHASTPILSGVLILPLSFTSAITGIVVGYIIHGTGRYLECIYIGTALVTIGNGLFIVFSASTSIGMLVGFQMVEGIGVGLLFEPPLIAVQSMVAQEDMATSTSTFTFVRMMGTCLSIVIDGVVFQNSMQLRKSNLQAAGLSTDLVEIFSGKNAAANVMLVRTLENPLQKMAVKEAFAWSMRNTWILNASIAFIGFVASFFVKQQHLTTEHTETVTGVKKDETM
jgi:MFS family permease